MLAVSDRVDIGLPPSALISTTSLSLPDDTSLDEYGRIVATVECRQDGGKWWLGDLIVEGRRLYGDVFSQAWGIDGVERYRQYERVSETVPEELRREEIPWHYYRALPYHCPLEVIASLVGEAIREQWSFDRWREAIDRYLNKTPKLKRDRRAEAIVYAADRQGEQWTSNDTQSLREILGC